MVEPYVNFMATCPQCRREGVTKLPIAAVAVSLLKGTIVELYASCHDIYWPATPLEVERIRAVMSTAGINIKPLSPNSFSSPDPTPPRLPLNHERVRRLE